MPPDKDERPELGSGFNFLNAPSAAITSLVNGSPVSYQVDRGYFLINVNFLGTRFLGSFSSISIKYLDLI